MERKSQRTAQADEIGTLDKTFKLFRAVETSNFLNRTKMIHLCCVVTLPLDGKGYIKRPPYSVYILKGSKGFILKGQLSSLMASDSLLSLCVELGCQRFSMPGPISKVSTYLHGGPYGCAS